MSESCPQCHSQSEIEGKIYNQVDYVNPAAFFRPNGMPFYAIFASNIQLQNRFFACSFCGLVWSRIESERLQSSEVKKTAL